MNVCVLACLPACLLWLDSSVSEITQKQWFSEITQKQWFSLDLVFVCLLARLLWLDSSASGITQKQWFPGITQKQWFSLDLVFVCLFVCLLAGLLAIGNRKFELGGSCTNHWAAKKRQDFTSYIPFTSSGRGTAFHWKILEFRGGCTGLLGETVWVFVQEGFWVPPLRHILCPYSVGYSMNVLWRESNRVSSSSLLVFIIRLVLPCPLFFMSCIPVKRMTEALMPWDPDKCKLKIENWKRGFPSLLVWWWKWCYRWLRMKWQRRRCWRTRRRESAVSIGSSTGLGVLAISGEVNAEKHETSPSCSVALFGGSQFRRLLSTGSNQDRLGRRI